MNYDKMEWFSPFAPKISGIIARRVCLYVKVSLSIGFIDLYQKTTITRPIEIVNFGKNHICVLANSPLNAPVLLDLLNKTQYYATFVLAEYISNIKYEYGAKRRERIANFALFCFSMHNLFVWTKSLNSLNWRFWYVMRLLLFGWKYILLCNLLYIISRHTRLTISPEIGGANGQKLFILY